MAQLLVELNREEGVTLIVVTHALDLAARMGRVIELREGKFVPYMTPVVETASAPSTPGSPAAQS